MFNVDVGKSNQRDPNKILTTEHDVFGKNNNYFDKQLNIFIYINGVLLNIWGAPKKCWNCNGGLMEGLLLNSLRNLVMRAEDQCCKTSCSGHLGFCEQNCAPLFLRSTEIRYMKHFFLYIPLSFKMYNSASCTSATWEEKSWAAAWSKLLTVRRWYSDQNATFVPQGPAQVDKYVFIICLSAAFTVAWNTSGSSCVPSL